MPGSKWRPSENIAIVGSTSCDICGGQHSKRSDQNISGRRGRAKAWDICKRSRVTGREPNIPGARPLKKHVSHFGSPCSIMNWRIVSRQWNHEWVGGIRHRYPNRDMEVGVELYTNFVGHRGSDESVGGVSCMEDPTEKHPGGCFGRVVIRRGGRSSTFGSRWSWSIDGKIHDIAGVWRRISPMDRILRTRTYGLKIRMTTKASGTVAWEGDRVLVNKIRFGIDDIRTVVHGLFEDVSQRFKNELILADGTTWYHNWTFRR